MTVALFLSGGAPNMTFMAGGLYEFEELGVEYSLVSTSGAGMLIGLLYAGPPGEGDVKTLRQEALRKVIDLYLDDRMFNFMDKVWGFPANYKVFHKIGPVAELYTKWWQDHRSLIPTPPFLSDDNKRLYNDWIDMILATACPSDFSQWSNAMCQHAPFIFSAVNFERLRQFGPDFVMNAYCLDTQQIELFKKEEITPEHFQAALSLPMIYAPYKLNGKTYIEGSAIDTICFEAIHEYLYEADKKAGTTTTSSGRAVPAKYRRREGRPAIDTMLVFNIMGHKQLLKAPRHLYDAITQEIMTPLVPLSNDDIKLFKLEHLPRYQQSNPDLKMIEIPLDLTEAQWDATLDWSRSNATALFDLGREAARKVFEANRDRLTPKAGVPAKPVRKTTRSKANVVKLSAA